MVTKIDYKYFTPHDRRFQSADFSEFEVTIGSDGSTIMLVEAGPKVMEKLFVVIDINTLQVLSERTICLVDEEEKHEINQTFREFEPPNNNESFTSEDHGLSYITKSKSLESINWDNGRYILTCTPKTKYS